MSPLAFGSCRICLGHIEYGCPHCHLAVAVFVLDIQNIDLFLQVSVSVRSY